MWTCTTRCRALSFIPDLPHPEHRLRTLDLCFSLQLEEGHWPVVHAALLIDRLFPYLRLSEDPTSNPKRYRELEKDLMAMWQAGRVHAMFCDQLEPVASVQMYHLGAYSEYTVYVSAHTTSCEHEIVDSDQECPDDGGVRMEDPESRESTPDGSIRGALL